MSELKRELPDAVVTVVVDATFAHRIDASELARFEEAALRGEYVYPPAGAIGRGDAFLLRIAERVSGIVLSNDSFQEFHGEHAWLFDHGRLLGATPVPGVGWIFVPRTPVRGPRSRIATRDAARAKEQVVKAIAEATKEAVEPDAQPGHAAASGRRRARRSTPAPQAVNDPTTFIGFIAEHPLGEQIEAVVESFTSHGAVARYGSVRCYVPLSGLGHPPPRSAREVLRRGEQRKFVVTALDPFRRGVELALPDIAVVSGHPSEETVEAEVRMARVPARAVVAPADGKAPRRAARTSLAPAGAAERPSTDSARPDAAPAKAVGRSATGAGRAAGDTSAKEAKATSRVARAASSSEAPPVTAAPRKAGRPAGAAKAPRTEAAEAERQPAKAAQRTAPRPAKTAAPTKVTKVTKAAKAATEAVGGRPKVAPALPKAAAAAKAAKAVPSKAAKAPSTAAKVAPSKAAKAATEPVRAARGARAVPGPATPAPRTSKAAPGGDGASPPAGRTRRASAPGDAHELAEAGAAGRLPKAAKAAKAAAPSAERARATAAAGKAAPKRGAGR